MGRPKGSKNKPGHCAGRPQGSRTVPRVYERVLSEYNADPVENDESLGYVVLPDVDITDSLRLIKYMCDRIESVEEDYKLTPQKFLNSLRKLASDIPLAIKEVISKFRGLQEKPEKETAESWFNRRAKVTTKQIADAKIYQDEDTTSSRRWSGAYPKWHRKHHAISPNKVYNFGKVKVG